MRLTKVLVSSWLAVALALASGASEGNEIQRRQDRASSALPTLGSGNSQSSSASVTPSASESSAQQSQSASISGASSTARSGSAVITSGSSTNITSTPQSTSSSSSAIPSPTAVTAINGTTNGTATIETALPLQPRITPALSIGGVVLILTGVVYGVIGVKNRWVHVSLSTAYLTSLSITVLIVYVLNPPVTNAIQGAYFVGIFMTGVIFGAGALVFKEVTEGLGCMLGGFCLSMWFLTLKEGGLITSTGGKAIFIAAFCVVAWSLSFSHYTRAYGLMGSTAFSGATAFVLGIDCFSRGGLKEFWVYIWDLNDNIFPLNTNTYPITRGARVESIVIILACIIGVISQMKLWKIVKDRQSRKNAEQEEESRRREAVEAALGRHLERQNDRDRSQWEKQYGDRLTAKRDTILWTDAHGEKGYSKIKEIEVDANQKSASAESLEMTNMARHSRSMYVTRIKRQSAPVSAIPEIEEGEPIDAAKERKRVLEKLEGEDSEARPEARSSPAPSPRPEYDTNGITITISPHDSKQQRSSIATTRKSVAIEQQDRPEGTRHSDLQQYLTAPEEKKEKKRHSLISYLSRSANGDDDARSATQSQEALVIPETSLRHSRASSLAATLDFENEHLDLPATDVDTAEAHGIPNIVLSAAETPQKTGKSQRYSMQDIVPSEPELPEEQLDVDPEEFVRPTTVTNQEDKRMSSGPSSPAKRQSGSEVGEDVSSDGYRPKAPTSDTTHSEVLTKGALELMPSQLSHVVMSYRTNEWAKHIAEADEPVFEEPEPIEGAQGVEVPTHLADPIPTVESRRASRDQPIPPQVSVPVPSALPSPTEGIRINPAIQPEQSLFSAVVKPQPSAMARAASGSSGIPRGFRSTSTPMLVKQSLQTTPIDENGPMDLARRQQNMRSASTQGLNEYNKPTASTSARPSTSMSNHQNLQHSTSRLSLVSESGVVPVARSVSQLSGYHPAPYSHGSNMHNPYQQNPYQAMAARSDTRLQSYDSHQPLKRNVSVENQRREAMLAEWRGVQQKAPEQADQAEVHRQQMLMERQYIKMMEEQEKNQKWQQEMAIDARMRGRDMQELHREAMRRMQAGVNRKMTN